MWYLILVLNIVATLSKTLYTAHRLHVIIIIIIILLMIWQSPGLPGWQKVNLITVTRRPHHPNINSSKKVLQFKFDLLYITLFSVFSTKIGIIRKLV